MNRRYVPMLVDIEYFTLLEAIAYEAGQAKQLMRNAGFGVSGTSLLRTTEEALQSIAPCDEEGWPV